MKSQAAKTGTGGAGTAWTSLLGAAREGSETTDMPTCDADVQTAWRVTNFETTLDTGRLLVQILVLCGCSSMDLAHGNSMRVILQRQESSGHAAKQQRTDHDKYKA